jgi:uncharacterized protein (DUF1330 family)
MVAFVIAEVDVTDPETYKAYQALTPGSVARHGGRFIARGGPTESLEGAQPKRVVIIEFESMAAARLWYHSPDYTEARAIREKAATARLYFVEGA